MVSRGATAAAVAARARFFLDKRSVSHQIEAVDNRRPDLTKRQKELARTRKAQEKAARRQERQRDREKEQSSQDGDPQEDPDIAGIVPGPQPPLEE